MNAAAKEEGYAVANMIADKCVDFQVRLSDAETDAITLSSADTAHLLNQLGREIYCIISTTQMQFKSTLSICLIEFEDWWKVIGVQELRKTIEQCVTYFVYPTIHLVIHVSKSIWRMRSADDVTTDIREQLSIGNVKVAYRCTNEVNYSCLMLKYNNGCTSLDYIKETLSHLALQGWYDIDFTKVFNLLYATNEWWSTCRACLLHLQHCQNEQFSCPVSQQIHHFSEAHVHKVYRSKKLTSLRDTSEDCGIPNVWQLFFAQLEGDFGHKVCWVVLGYDQNALKDSIFNNL